MQLGRLWPTVMGGEAHVDLFRACLAVDYLDIEVSATLEDAGVEKVERRAVAVATGILLDHPFIRIGGLRIFVEVVQVTVGGRSIDVEVVLLDVLAAIALRPGQPEGAFLEE